MYSIVYVALTLLRLYATVVQNVITCVYAGYLLQEVRFRVRREALFVPLKYSLRFVRRLTHHLVTLLVQ